VVSITQDIFGETVVPGTFAVTIGANKLFDTKTGDLYTSQSGIGYIVGRIFYDKGVAIIKPTSSIVGGIINKDGMYIDNGTNVKVDFTSSVKIYEHAIKVKIDPAEFNVSPYNPSVEKVVYTGSLETPFQMMTSRSRDPRNTKLLAPYVTTIGLYNPDNELLAVAKVSNPIQRTFDSAQTFILKFDT
jgi:hypothetical protein